MPWARQPATIGPIAMWAAACLFISTCSPPYIVHSSIASSWLRCVHTHTTHTIETNVSSGRRRRHRFARCLVHHHPLSPPPSPSPSPLSLTRLLTFMPIVWNWIRANVCRQPTRSTRLPICNDGMLSSLRASTLLSHTSLSHSCCVAVLMNLNSKTFNAIVLVDCLFL